MAFGFVVRDAQVVGVRPRAGDRIARIEIAIVELVVAAAVDAVSGERQIRRSARV